MKQLLILCLAIVLLTGCRGFRSEQTPIHLNINLDFQSKFKSQSLPLNPPQHVVAWGANAVYDADTERPFFIGDTTRPKVTKEVLDRGQERFNIYCSVCHDKTGSGHGMVVQRGFLPPPDLIDERLLAESDAYLFGVITHGIRNMPSYSKQISPDDRWAIVAYVRALQISRTSSAKEKP